MRELSCEVDKLNYKYKLLIERKVVEDAIVQRLMDIGKRVKMPGFRPGHIPLPVLMKNFGESVRRDAIVDAVKEQINQLVKEKGLKVAFQPSAEIAEHNDEGVVVNVSIDTVPEVELVDMQGMDIKKYLVKFDEEAINKFLEDVLDRNLIWNDKDGVSEEGDRVIIDIKLTSDTNSGENSSKKKGKKINQEKAESVPVILGKDDFVEDFWKNLVGLKSGDEKDFSVDYGEGDAQSYHVCVKSVQASTRRKLDEDFAKLIGVDSTDKIRLWALEHLNAEYASDERDIVKKQLLDKLSEMYSFDVPQSMVTLEQKEILRQFEVEANKEGKSVKKDKYDDVMKDCLDIAVRRVRLGLVIAKIATENNISITQNELRQAVFSIAKMYKGHELEVVKRYFNDQGLMAAVAGPLLEEKVVSFILDKYVKLETVEVTKEELDKVGEDSFNFFNDDYLEVLPTNEEPAAVEEASEEKAAE